MFDYIADGQITMFDFIENNHKFAPIIDELSSDIKAVFTQHEYIDEYRVWDHVPYLGYRYSTSIAISKQEYNTVIEKLIKIEAKYAKKRLEVSITQTPCFGGNGDIVLFISTIWKEKHRAKNG